MEKIGSNELQVVGLFKQFELLADMITEDPIKGCLIQHLTNPFSINQVQTEVVKSWRSIKMDETTE